MTDELQRQVLGRTGMEITRVGFGSWALGGGDWVSSWGPQDDEASVAAIRHAIESGVNWIDTAAVYGLGHAEEVVARAVSVYADVDRPFIFTKGGLVWDDENRRQSSAKVGRASSIRRGVDASLKRLGCERIDLYFMHWPAEDGTAIEDYWQTLLDLKAEGKLASIGLSNHDASQVERAEKVGHVDAIQPPFSAIYPAASRELLPWALENQTGVVVYSPMASGLLSGGFSAQRVATLAEDDWRKKSPAFTTDLTANLEIAAAVERVARRHGVSAPATAVAWTLGFPGVTGAIVGARTPAQVDGWVPAARLELTDADYREIAPEFVPLTTSVPQP